MGIGYWLSLICLAGLLYWAPGYALLRMVGGKSAGWGDRIWLPLACSMILVPTLLAAAGSYFPFRPSALHPLALTLIILALGAWLRRIGVLPISSNAGESEGRAARREAVLVGAFVLIFAGIMNLPRISMLLQGDQALAVRPWDEHWHLAQLVSIARSGLPPQHYFFPDRPLAYYYWSWIYPAAIANQPLVELPLARAMALHAYVQIVGFLGLGFMLLRRSFHSRLARVSGLAFLTIFGGFDLYPAFPEIEWWQTKLPWLHSNVQISQFATIYTWVPQHLAGAMGFLAALLIARSKALSGSLKAGLLALIGAFILGTSPFVFLAACLGGLIWVVVRPPGRLGSPGRIIRLAAVFMVLFAIFAGPQLLLTLQHPGGIGWSDFRITLLESYFGSASPAIGLDRALTLLGFPLISAWLLAIEIGLPFGLYLLWCARFGFSSRSGWDRWLSWFPLAGVFCFVFLLTDRGGGSNLAMRGMIPAQIAIVLAACSWVDRLELRGVKAGPRAVLGYGALLLCVAQMAPWAAQLKQQSNAPFEAVRVAGADGARGDAGLIRQLESAEWAPELEYVFWLNRNTEKDAVVLECGGPAQQDHPVYRQLERQRVLAWDDFTALGFWQRDYDFLLSGEQNESPIEDACAAVDLWTRSGHYDPDRPAYLVSWGEPQAGLGLPLYQVGGLLIYRHASPGE